MFAVSSTSRVATRANVRASTKRASRAARVVVKASKTEEKVRVRIVVVPIAARDRATVRALARRRSRDVTRARWVERCVVNVRVVCGVERWEGIVRGDARGR